LTCSAFDTNDKPLNPSPFLSRIKQLFPQLEFETSPRTFNWRESEHANELIAPVLKIQNSKFKIQNWDKLAELPPLKLALDRLQHFQIQAADESLSPELARQLYGTTLLTSVSRLEQFAACPFRFFVHSGLRAEERKLFELDVREQGSFQHDVLKEFHEQLHREGKHWRDITPREARERVGKIAQSLVADYRDGLLQSSDETKFTARVLIESLQDFVETLVDWMARQYAFDPVAVELPFGESDAHPAWELDLGKGHRLALRGRIDRVDVCRETGSDEALCVVVDYKSSQKKLDSLLIVNGLQLQLLAYLNVLRRWPNPRELFGAAQLVPAGIFYVNLRGKYKRQSNRNDALAETAEARKLAYQHSGRFDAGALQKLDSRKDAVKGDQFNYRKNKDGSLGKTSREALTTEEFTALLETVELNLKTMGREIFSGSVQVSPFRKGAMTACDQCDYQAICRIDPWTHPFRALKNITPDE
jgi:ATP-dependent helicase/nuclease subunit B